MPDHCKASTAYEYGRSVSFFIEPRIGKRKVRDIKRSDIAELHHALRETPYQANRTLGVLSKMFSLAEMWGWRPDGSNPCLHIKRYKEEKRERFLSAEEFARLGKVLDETLRDGSETRSAVVAIRLLMLTGCRLSEIQKLKWEHVELEAGRAAPARHQDWRAGSAVGTISGTATGGPAPRRREPVGDRRPEARQPSDRPSAPLAAYPGEGGA